MGTTPQSGRAPASGHRREAEGPRVEEGRGGGGECSEGRRARGAGAQVADGYTPAPVGAAPADDGGLVEAYSSEEDGAGWGLAGR